MFFDQVYYEPAALDYPLGRELQAKFSALPWHPIENHNRIPELQSRPNADFTKLKRHLIIGVRKTHRYSENHKVSDYLVPYTSSGCSAMCLYCYLVCHYNKCSYLRLFVNREAMMEKLIHTANRAERPLTFEIGSNSDLILENTVTGNLPWTIREFSGSSKGLLTFPTKFAMVEPLLALPHGERVIFRMSVNPQQIIRTFEPGTSPLQARVAALNEMSRAGYRVGLLIAPVILLDDYQRLYTELVELLADTLAEPVKKNGFIEIILMTYSYVHRAINAEAFPNAPSLFSEKLTGRGKGKYGYRDELRREAEAFLRGQIEQKLKMPVLYVV